MNYLFYEDNVYPLYAGNTYRMGSSVDSNIYLPCHENIMLDVKETGVELLGKTYTYGSHQVSIDDKITISLFVVGDTEYYLLPERILYLSDKKEATIRLVDFPTEIILTFDGINKTIYSVSPYYINGEIKTGKHNIQDLDQIVFEQGVGLSIQKQILSIHSLFSIETSLLPFSEVSTEDRSKEFHRSPRIILREPDDKVTIASAPTDDEGQKQSLLRLIITPLAMIVFTLLTVYFTRSGGMMFMMMGMSVITIGTSIHTYFSDKKSHKELQEQKITEYMKYLETKYSQLADLRDEQVEALVYHFPDMSQILEMVEKTDRRIYEKTLYHFDFLSYRLGLGEIDSSFSIQYSNSELTKYNAAANQKIQELLSYYRVTKQVPITHTLTNPTGYIGTRQIVIEQVQQMMMQLATFQSYHDLQFIPIFREEELEIWNWSRWLPHTKIRALNSRGFVYNQRTRDQLLTSLYQIIKDRKLDSEQDKGKEKQYSPHYILFITDLSLMLDHNIMEYINEDLSYLGIHYVFVEEVLESLPEHVKTVVDYRGDKKATLLLQDGNYTNKEITPLI